MPVNPAASASAAAPVIGSALPPGATITAVITPSGNTTSSPTGSAGASPRSDHDQQPSAIKELLSPPYTPSTRSTSPLRSPSSTSGHHRSFSRTVNLSPIDLFSSVDPRYPDIIATLSNALHFLNKTGFDHDQVHEHITADELIAFEQNGDLDDDIADDLTGVSKSYRGDGDDRRPPLNGDDAGDAGDMVTPSDSDYSCSSDEEDEGGAAGAAARRNAANGTAAHIRKPEESFPPATPDVGSPDRGTPGPVSPEQTTSAPNAAPGPLHASSGAHGTSSRVTESHTTHRATSLPVPAAEEGGAESGDEGDKAGLFHRHHHTHGSRHHHHRRKTMDTRVAPKDGNEATSMQQHYPSIAHSDQASEQDKRDNPQPQPGTAGRDGSQAKADVKEDTKTEVTESVDKKENDDSVVTTVTTVTTTVHTVVKTTTVLKEKGAVVTAAQSPETAVVWTPTEQSQLLEEILIFYVDLYWENQASFAPFYKRRLDTWNDKALMIYRHLFQDEKFKSDTKKYLKEPLVEFFEEQLILKSGQRVGRAGALLPPGANAATRSMYSASPSSTNSVGGGHFAHLFSPGAASTTQQGNELSVSGGNSLMSPTPSPSSSLAPPSPTPSGQRRKSSFSLPSLPSLPNPLAGIFGSGDKSPSPPAEPDETELYLQRANAVCNELHGRYIAVTRTTQQLIAKQILTEQGGLPPTISTADELNRAVATILCSREVLQLLSEYHPAYQTAVCEFPGRVLMSRTLRHRIESPASTPLNITDLIVGVNEITEILRKCFQKLARLHPDMIQRLVASKRLKTLREIHHSQRKDKAGYPDSFSAWLYESRVYPKLFGSDTFDLLKQVGWCDAKTFCLISEHRLQEALWRLKDLNRDRESAVLEALIYDKILGDEAANVSGVENLGGGFTTTKLINFPSQDIRGVYKPDHGTLGNPKDWKLQTLKDSIVSNYKKEIAAYVIDKLMKINHVPITKATNFHGELGSLQYFVSDATVARALNDIDMKNPTKAGKWTSANGRTELPRTIKLYDWFINNRDRNLDNYLVADDGRFILIDHGWTFVAPPTNPSSQFLKSIIPREDVYRRVKALHDDQPLIDAELGDLLGKGNLAAFKSRLKTFVNYVEKRIAKKGREETFKVPNAEDWHPVLDD